MEGVFIEEILECMKFYLKDCIVYGVGNIYGLVELFVEVIIEMKKMRKVV